MGQHLNKIKNRIYSVVSEGSESVVIYMIPGETSFLEVEAPRTLDSRSVGWISSLNGLVQNWIYNISIEMDSSPFYYSIPFPSQTRPIFSAPPPSPYLFLMAPNYNFQFVMCNPPEISGIRSQNTLQQTNNTQNWEFQQKIIDQASSKSQFCMEDSLQFSKGKKKLRVERLRDDKGRYYGVRKLPVKEKYKQNPKRNVITNIGNQLLAFASNKARSVGVIRKAVNGSSEEQISSFYEFMVDLRKQTDYYLNIVKMKQIWYPMAPDTDERRLKNRSLLRVVSYHYLNNMIHLFILNSAKIKRSSKIYHVKAIKSLLKELAPRCEV